MDDRKVGLLTSLLIGLSGALVMIAFAFFIKASPAQRFAVLPFVSTLMMVLVIFLVSWRVKYGIYKGFVDFLSLAKLNLMGMLVYVLITQLFSFGFLKTIGQEPMVKIGQEGSTEAYTPSAQIVLLISIALNLFIGFIISSLVAGLMKRNREEDKSNVKA